MSGAEKLLDKLKDEFRLFVTSNGVYKVTRSRLQLSGCIDIFENVFISERIGVEKPNPDFLNIACSSIEGFNKERAVIVGDSLTSDILEGINFGIKTIWFNCRNRNGREDVKPDYVIYSLDELPELLHLIFKTSDN